MRVALLTHPASLRHDTGWHHPERAARIPAVVSGVHEAGLDVVELEAPRVSRPLLEGVHRSDYVDAIERFCRSGGGSLDPDTVAVAASWEAALRSAGAGPAAVDALRRGDAEAAFVATRPPGHHALAARAMGFCLFNNIAVTAAALVAAGERVAIVDWDVHHGNGTQETFRDTDQVLYVSWHEYPAYPGTGGIDEIGATGAGATTINFPFPTGTGGGPYRWTMATVVAPVLAAFAPDWILVSAGYDAHRSDPLAGIRLVADDYRVLGAAVAAGIDPGRLVFFLEGGYHLDAMRHSVTATLQGAALPTVSPPPEEAAGRAWDVAERARVVTAARWGL
jgi:acetoin utilization deacetylase AcuC-like enzyme